MSRPCLRLGLALCFGPGRASGAELDLFPMLYYHVSCKLVLHDHRVIHTFSKYAAPNVHGVIFQAQTLGVGD